MGYWQEEAETDRSSWTEIEDIGSKKGSHLIIDYPRQSFETGLVRIMYNTTPRGYQNIHRSMFIISFQISTYVSVSFETKRSIQRALTPTASLAVLHSRLLRLVPKAFQCDQTLHVRDMTAVEACFVQPADRLHAHAAT